MAVERRGPAVCSDSNKKEGKAFGKDMQEEAGQELIEG